VKYGTPAFFSVAAQPFRRFVMYGLLAVDFGLGKRYWLPGVSSISRRKASCAGAVIGMSPIPFGVFEAMM
jgi:hypothetical protein